MKALLFSMPNIYPEWDIHNIRYPSIGLASMAANAENHEVYVGDLILKRRNIRGAIKKALEKYSPDVVGLSAMTFQFPTLVKVAKYIKSLDPSIPLVLGGYHATTGFDFVIEDDCARYFDYIIRGEGDIAFGELLDEIEGTGEISRIKGLSYNKDGKWNHNEPRPPEDLCKIKLPDRDSRIWKGYHIFSEKLDTLEASRGCLNKCNFCSILGMYGTSRREYPIGRIIQDIKNARDRGVKHLSFVDDNLTMDARGLKRFEELLEAIIRNGLDDIKYSTQVSSVGMGTDEKIVIKMRKAGFEQVFLGIENVASANLDYCNKGNIIDHSRRAVQYLRDNGVMIMGGIINGMEDDTEENFKANFDYLMDSRIDNLLAQLLTPYPGTALRDEMIDADLLTNRDNWTTYSGYYANSKTKHLSTKELDFMQWKYHSIYYSWRMRCFWKLNVFKLYPYHIIKAAVVNYFRSRPSSFRKIGKSEWEKFEIDTEVRKRLNENLI